MILRTRAVGSRGAALHDETINRTRSRLQALGGPGRINYDAEYGLSEPGTEESRVV